LSKILLIDPALFPQSKI